MKFRRRIAIGALIVTTLVYLTNASWIAGPGMDQLTLLSHRGVHQTYHRNNLTNETCTATRIDPPSHGYIENTIDSMAAARGYGANMIELDIHPTTDGEFVVFHDWTVDCRTEGSGRTRDHSLEALKSLDIGYGYTADGGQTFPFRGQFVGAMPTLNAVLDTYPHTIFVVNIKSRSKKEARDLLDYLDEDEWERIVLVGHPDPLGVIEQQFPEVIGMSRARAKACLKGYVLTGWFGRVPAACHDTIVPVPLNYRRLMWGWPHRFERRLNANGSRSMVVGDLGDHLAGGVDGPNDISRVPKDYTGIVYTNKIEVVGPVFKSRGQSDE